MSDDTLDTNTALEQPIEEATISNDLNHEEPILTLVQANISPKEMKAAFTAFFKEVTDKNFADADQKIETFIKFAQNSSSNDIKDVLLTAFQMAVNIETFRLTDRNFNKNKADKPKLKNALSEYRNNLSS